MSKLRTYGVLPGATGYDLCCMYPVFPNEDTNDFYFVFDYSKTQLRFQILEENRFAIDQRFCVGQNDQIHSVPDFVHPPRPVQIPPLDTNPEELILGLEDLRTEPEREGVADQNTTISRKENECRYLFEKGYINEHALKVLERVAELVQIQADLLAGMENTPSPDSRFKFDESRVNLMISSRSSHSRPTASMNEDNSPSKKFRLSTQYDPSEVHEFDMLLNDFHHGIDEKENADPENIANAHMIDPSPTTAHEPKNTIFIYKRISKHEISIYSNEIIRSSPYFPKYMGSCTEYEDKENEDDVRVELEEIMPGDYFDLRFFSGYTNGLFGAKFLVDIFGALMTLHSIGYIHGDVTPANVGYNKELGIWQLFDFDNSRPIEEAAQGKGEYHGTPDFKSAHYAKTGKYCPFDDFVGAMNSFALFNSFYEIEAQMTDTLESSDCFEPFFNNLTRKFGPLSQKELHQLYLEAVKLLWEKCKENPRERSIINAKIILTSSFLIRK